MPLDVIMPALGMAQDTGLIVSWHKKPGDPVAKGDVLFEVETDKATMEVESQGAGFLTDVTAEAGSEVPVGDVIARISDTAESSASEADSAQGSGADDAPAAPSPEDLPEGKDVIMPTLGMAQDTGLLVSWHKAAGDAVSADDVLFEVETDKSTMEVVAGQDGFVAALLAGAGEDVPVGQTIAIISATAPENPVTRTAGSAGKPAPAAAPKAPEPAAAPPAKPKAAQPAAERKAAPVPSGDGRILASPKLRRLAREQGLDLSRIVKAGVAQPFHVKDLDVLKSLPADQPKVATTATCRLTAELASDGFADFAAWAAKEAALSDPAALLAGFGAASLGRAAIVAVETFGETRTYAADARLSAAKPSEEVAELRLRDLRFTPITTVQVGAEETPTLTLTRSGAGLTITLEYAGDHLGAAEAISLLSNFAGRIEEPLRHLL